MAARARPIVLSHSINQRKGRGRFIWRQPGLSLQPCSRVHELPRPTRTNSLDNEPEIDGAYYDLEGR
jgi:hypothetical protein